MGAEPKLDKETSKQLDDFRQSVAEAAENVIFRVFPSKILELQGFIDSTQSPSSPFHMSHAAISTDPTIYPPPETTHLSDEPDTKKRKLSDGGIAPSFGGNDVQNARFPNLVTRNKHLDEVHQIVKGECEQLADHCDKVKLWINLTMPKIEDGDNFGVQIQEEVLAELHRAQESAYGLRDSARQNHLNRAKICTKLIKYPHVEDYTFALKEHDERQLYVSRRNLLDLRNIYAVISDILHKNIAKLRTPKGNNRAGLY